VNETFFSTMATTIRTTVARWTPQPNAVVTVLHERVARDDDARVSGPLSMDRDHAAPKNLGQILAATGTSDGIDRCEVRVRFLDGDTCRCGNLNKLFANAPREGSRAQTAVWDAALR